MSLEAQVPWVATCLRADLKKTTVYSWVQNAMAA